MFSQSPKKEAEAKSEQKVERATSPKQAVLDPNKYDNDKFWDELYSHSAKNENLQKDITQIMHAVNKVGCNQQADNVSFPELNAIKKELANVCKNPRPIFMAMENCKIKPKAAPVKVEPTKVEPKLKVNRR